jgi:hypothetical protein
MAAAFDSHLVKPVELGFPESLIRRLGKSGRASHPESWLRLLTGSIRARRNRGPGEERSHLWYVGGACYRLRSVKPGFPFSKWTTSLIKCELIPDACGFACE